MTKASERTPRLRVCPITDNDLPEVAQFLGANFPPATSAAEWANAWRSTVNLRGSEAPNHGFLLRAGNTIVGAYPAIYSTRDINGRRERFCNLSAWYVLPEYRTGSIRMVRAILGQQGFHFTDLSPIEVVQRLNQRLGFRYLDTDTALVPNLPWPTTREQITISADPVVIAGALTGQVRTFYQDHRRCRWARHLVLLRRDEPCYVQWRIESRKGLPLFASIQYASNPTLLRRGFRSLARHFLLRHRAPFSLVEVRVVGGRIRPSALLRNHRPRMFKSATLCQDQIDYLYSEITAAP